ncbi:Gag polyprotein [Labeo rohita]|uniref:Gag polyprotein n=1 Tax=Labeo rohita TaxID=84645 RepID=A0ABQ8L5N1_LABRO|nr:Gag polyprotein [Labeo rohita]
MSLPVYPQSAGAIRSDEVFTSLVCLDTLRPTHPSPHFTSGSQSLTQHLVVPPHLGFYTTQICVSPSSPQRANMPQTADPIAQGEDVNNWLRGMTDCLTPKTFELGADIDKLEVKVQDQLRAPNEREQETTGQVKKLQATLATAQRDQQQANAAQKDLVNRLQYATLKAKKGDTSLSPPLLSRTDSHVQELASNERSEGPQPKTSPAFATEFYFVSKITDPIQADLRAAHGMTIKDHNKLSNNISKFNLNSKESHNIQAHLQDIDFHLEMRSQVTDRDRSSPQVQNFLDGQPKTKQGRQETPQAYYNRLRQAYFGAHNKPDLEEDVNFKSLFIKNLHPGVSRHLGIMACPRSMTIQQLHDLTQKAYNKQKMASKKGNKTAALLNSVTKDSSLALDDTQWHHDTRVLHQEHRERDPYVHDSYQPSRCKKPWGKPHFSEIPIERIYWKPNWMCKASRPAHPRTTCLGKQRQNPHQHYSDKHGTESSQEQACSPSQDMKQVMKELKEFLENQLNTND